LLAGCTAHGTSAAPSSTLTGPPYTLRVLASGELADLEPILEQAAHATGVSVQLTLADSLSSSRLVAEGQAAGRYDAVWLSSIRYLAMLAGAMAKLDGSTPIMSSPVVVGVRSSVARRLGWDHTAVSWSDIAAAAGAHRFSFGMEDPGRSDSGLSALVGVATAVAGGGSPLEPAQTAKAAPVLRELFSGQSLKEPSSKDLTDAYVHSQAGSAQGAPVDGLITYESVLLSLNASGKLREPLTLIYPTNGMATADYAFGLLASAPTGAMDAYVRLTNYLRTPDVQRAIMRTTRRRPANPAVALDPDFGRHRMFELPFPTSIDVINDLAVAYAGTLRRPARSVYVLDTSGSMTGQRISALKAAIDHLTDTNAAFVSPGTALQTREQVTFVPFSTVPAPAKTFGLPPDDSTAALRAIRTYISELSPGGQTALYDALVDAYRLIERQAATDPYRITSIVLLSDGESNTGRDLAQFTAFYRSLPKTIASVPVYPVLFAQSADAQMRQLALLTGGRVFDGRTQTLAKVFGQISGSQ
jgi:Ca-activated chloride channel family protein